MMMKTWSHGMRVTIMWIVGSVIATPLVAIFLGPILPPGNGSLESHGQVVDNTVMTAVVTPVLVLVAVWIGYTLIVFRAGKDGVLEGPRVRGDMRVQTLWVVLTSVTVLLLAGYGSYRLLDDGAGSGQGPSPIAPESGPKLEVQVIGQQWAFTYRYPSYGGVETSQLVLPADQVVEFHVTSLDAVHSFWAYGLGVKADANPGTDNVAYVTTRKPRTFDIHCAELCGLWHGYMFDTGRVVSPADFTSWIESQRQMFAPIAKSLPPYSRTYLPDPQRRAG